MINLIWKQGIFLLLVCCFFSGYGQGRNPLRMQLVVPMSNPEGAREISLERYRALHVILTNVSDKDQHIWKDWNTWGYFNLTLEWKSGPRTTAIRRKPPKAWDGDFPDFWTIKPGESVVLNIDMSTGEWDGFPDLYGEVIPATLTATYQNKSDMLAKEFDVWVGKLTTDPIDVIFK